MQRVLITGGAGFIGSHLCERLLAEGNEVICVDNFLTGEPDNVAHLFSESRFSFIQQDVTNYIYVKGPVDAILHFASPASPVDYLELPIQTLKVGSLGTHKALGLAREKGARFLLASTSEVYGDPLVHPQSEDYWGNVNPIGPRGVYDEAKRFAEALTMAYRRAHGMETRIVRIFNSVLAEEPVVLFDRGRCRIVGVGEYASTWEGEGTAVPREILVPAFDPATGKIELRPASALLRHESSAGDAFEVRVSYGRRVKVTGDHSLFRRGRDGRPEAVPVRDLVVGDEVAVPGCLPAVERDWREVDVVAELVERGPGEIVSRYALVSRALPALAAAERERIAALVEAWAQETGAAGGAVPVSPVGGEGWLERGVLPLQVLTELRRTSPLVVPGDARLCPIRGGGDPGLPARLEVSEELLWLLGLLLARGGLDQGGAGPSLVVRGRERCLVRAEAILGSSGLGARLVRRRGGAGLEASSPLLLWVLSRVFGVGLEEAERGVPGWVVQLPLARLKHFVEGYSAGGGAKGNGARPGEIVFAAAGRRMARELAYLLLRFGLLASQEEVPGGRLRGSWQVAARGLSTTDVLAWDRGVEQAIAEPRFGDLVWVRVEDVRACPSSRYVYDLSVPGAENFVAGDAVACHNTFGPRMRQRDGRVVPNFIAQALRGEPLTVYGDGSQTRSFCYISDLVEGIVRLLRCSCAEPVNLGNPRELSVLEFAKTVIRLTGSKSQITFRPLPVDDPKVRQPDVSRARRLLGWEPQVSLEEGLARTIEDFRVRMGISPGT